MPAEDPDRRDPRRGTQDAAEIEEDFMLIKPFVVGPIGTNCYLVAGAEKMDAAIIDPDIRTNEEKESVMKEIDRRNLQLKYIINTHHHIDHTGGNDFLKKNTSAEILIHELDGPVLFDQWKWILTTSKGQKPPPCPTCGNVELKVDIIQAQRKAVLRCRDCDFKFEAVPSPPADRLLHNGDMIKVGKIELEVIHTPGHSAGGVSLYIKKENVIFTGDTLFCGSVGRTDNIDASYEDIIKSVKALTKLPDDTVVYPGHGDKTTIGREKRENPYLKDQN
jgi:glyoxylase-like metal-dependent hydrolase (beta-lactamase superfamily II)